MKTARLPAIIRTLLFSFSFPLLLNADSWMAVEIQTFSSKDKDFIFVVVPASYPDPKYPSAKTDPEIQRLLSQNKTCVGSLMKYFEQSKSYLPIWTRPLSNIVSPVSAMISDDGKYVVTTGEWYGGGHAAIAICIYNSTGKLIRSLTATDILGEERINYVPASSTITFWGKVKEIDTKRGELVIEEWKSGSGLPDDPNIFRERRIKLIDGSFIDGSDGK